MGARGVGGWNRQSRCVTLSATVAGGSEREKGGWVSNEKKGGYNGSGGSESRW